ncbi:MAG: DUF2202 domain-containing protein [Rhodoferax sp.]|nr:DUF2202 domain-containing protein [Rhodoferax sp.]MCF8208540.1 DUF2202 domain-containing protein [Rhodoferax sp.]
MKTQLTKIAAICLSTLALGACGGGGDNAGAIGNGGPPLVVDANGVSSFNATTLGASLVALPMEALSATEKESLLFMREEEKLAHDVYAQLDLRWGSSTRSFGSIASSEATHTEAVRQLLLRYSLPDPAPAAAGQFQNTVLQGLYNQLTTAGAVSLAEALKVGAAIEEIDMVDINKAMLSIDNQDMVLVYQNLLKGSRNHLRSFVGSLANLGISYVPQYMPAADYQLIISTPMERG